MTLPLYRILGIILLCDGRCHFDICTRIRVLILLCPTNDGTIASRKRNVHRGHPRMASGYRNFDVRFTVNFLCTKPRLRVLLESNYALIVSEPLPGKRVFDSFEARRD